MMTTYLLITSVYVLQALATSYLIYGKESIPSTGLFLANALICITVGVLTRLVNKSILCLIYGIAVNITFSRLCVYGSDGVSYTMVADVIFTYPFIVLGYVATFIAMLMLSSARGHAYDKT